MYRGLILAPILLAGLAVAQNTQNTVQTPAQAERAEPVPARTKSPNSAKRDVGTGAGDIGMGAAKGAGSAAKGTGKAALDLVTLHPATAAADFGKGAANTGKNVGVGTAKGAGKMLRGAGKAIKHLF